MEKLFELLRPLRGTFHLNPELHGTRLLIRDIQCRCPIIAAIGESSIKNSIAITYANRLGMTLTQCAIVTDAADDNRSEPAQTLRRKLIQFLGIQ